LPDRVLPLSGIRLEHKDRVMGATAGEPCRTISGESALVIVHHRIKIVSAVVG
jgi:hypothetical protein